MPELPKNKREAEFLYPHGFLDSRFCQGRSRRLLQIANPVPGSFPKALALTAISVLGQRSGMQNAQNPVLRVVTERDDYRAFVQYEEQKLFRTRFWVRVLAIPAVLLGVTAFEAWRLGGLMALIRTEPLAVLVPGTIFLWAASRWQALERKARRLALKEYPGLSDLKLEADSLVVESDPRRRRYAWKDMVGIVEDNGLMMFVHKRSPGVFKATMVPLRPEASDARYLPAFRQRAHQLWEAAHATVASAAPVQQVVAA